MSCRPWRWKYGIQRNIRISLGGAGHLSDPESVNMSGERFGWVGQGDHPAFDTDENPRTVQVGAGEDVMILDGAYILPD